MNMNKFKLYEDLQNYILDYIPHYPKYLSNCQLVCKRWKHVLQDKLDTVYWNKVENLIGEKETDKLKQGAKFEGELDLRSKKLNGGTCKILAKILVEMKGLKRLCLWENNIGDEGCRHLAKVLVEMKGLKLLSLGRNNIGDEGCRHLAKVLVEMKGLKTLGLAWNNIDAEGCRHLVPALAEMKGLERLWLRENNIGEEGKKVMREAWEKAGKHVDNLRLL